MEDIRVLLGNRVKTLRENLKISQEELGFISDLDRTYISSIENGKRNVSIINIQKIANALGYSLKDFFNTEDFTEIYTDEDSMVAEKKPVKYK